MLFAARRRRLFFFLALAPPAEHVNNTIPLIENVTNKLVSVLRMRKFE
jgi:hypothetical protein